MSAPKTSRPWEPDEEAFVREHFPSKGGRWCAQKLKRTIQSISRKARKLGVYRLHPPGAPVELTPLLDEQIRNAYGPHAAKGAVSRLAERTGLSRTWISNRAEKIRARKARPERRAWTDREMEILEANAKASAITISRILQKAGFRRTAEAVERKKVKLRPDTSDTGFHSTSEIVELLGVGKTSVHRWIRQGWLIPDHGARGEDEGRMLVSDDALARFIIAHPSAVDLSKIQAAGSSAWFIDLLARKGTVASLTPAESQADRIIALVNARPELLNDRRQVALLLEIPFESCTVTISQAIKAGRIQPARVVA